MAPPTGVASRGSQARAVGAYVPRLTRTAFAKYGFSAATLITDWKTIMGADIALWARPERLKWPRPAPEAQDPDAADGGRTGATLILRVDPGRALDVQYRTRQIIERINAYFGYRAVASLRIVQGALHDAMPGPREAMARGGARRLPTFDMASVADEGLRKALEGMAAGLAARSGRSRA